MRFLFGCWHKKTSFPMTRRKSALRPRQDAETYIVCLECGKELPYSWETMKVIKRDSRLNEALRPTVSLPQTAGSRLEY